MLKQQFGIVFLLGVLISSQSAVAVTNPNMLLDGQILGTHAPLTAPFSVKDANLAVALTHTGSTLVGGSVHLNAALQSTIALTTFRFISSTVEDVEGAFRFSSSLAIGADQLPMVSYYMTSTVKIAQCQDIDCTRIIPQNTIDTHIVPSEFNYLAMAIGTDGLPVIAYEAAPNGPGLMIAKCQDTKCANTIRTVLDVGRHLPYSIAIDNDNLPIVTYLNFSAPPSTSLKVAKCLNVNCTSSILTSIDGDGVGGGMSIALGADGLPVISYVASGYNLKVATCVISNCSSGIIAVIDRSGNVNPATSLSIGSDGLPAISYYDQNNLQFKFAKCLTVSCTFSSLTTMDASPRTGPANGISVGPSNLPILVYSDEVNGSFKMAVCETVDCSSAITTTVDSTRTVGSAPSLKVGADGLPIVSYFNSDRSTIKVAKALPPITYTLDYGDGTPLAHGGWQANLLPFTHRYTAPGVYKVTITATNSLENEMESAVASTIVIVGKTFLSVLQRN